MVTDECDLVFNGQSTGDVMEVGVLGGQSTDEGLGVRWEMG